MTAFENITLINVYLNKINAKYMQDIHSFHRILNRDSSKIEEINFISLDVFICSTSRWNLLLFI